jgi:polar amino acid transport system substrate-binding protein
MAVLPHEAVAMKQHKTWFATLAGMIMLVMSATVHAQSSAKAEIAQQLAPTGKLRVGVLMVSYFALEDAATHRLTGIVPDLGNELARRLNVPAELIPIANPPKMLDAFRRGELDVTFIGITADRAELIEFGPVVLDLQTTYLVPASSRIQSIAEIDQPGLRILVPQRSAQEAHLKKTIGKATMISVAVETPKPAVELLKAGQADAFSHVVPMLVSAQPDLPGSRILPGSYYNVPIAAGLAKGRPPTAADYWGRFADEVKKSGFVQQAIERAGVKGVVVGPQ